MPPVSERKGQKIGLISQRCYNLELMQFTSGEADSHSENVLFSQLKLESVPSFSGSYRLFCAQLLSFFNLLPLDN